MITGRRLALKKCLYLPVEQSLVSPYIGCYHSYGIVAIHLSFFHCSVSAFISDVSSDYDFVLSLANLFTHKHLDPLHLFDVIVDSI